MATSSLLQDADDLPTDPRQGHSNAELGPSDSSDSGSDTAGLPNTAADSDAQGTGERASVDPSEPDKASDLIPDTVVDEERAMRSAPDGGDDEDDADDERDNGE